MTIVKRESAIVQKTLFRFVKQVTSLAQQLTDAAVMQFGRLVFIRTHGTGS